MTSLTTKHQLIKATLPLGFRMPKGKWIPISGSWYRNAYHYDSNRVKVRYTELASRQLVNATPIDGVVYSLFVLYKENNKRLDLDNYTTVHKKFFNDALVQNKILKDDSTDDVPFQLSLYGGIDKQNPRVDIYVSTDLTEIGKLTRQLLWQEN